MKKTNDIALGRRKEAVARVIVKKGTGKILVNDKDYKVYFPLIYLQNQVELPLKTIESLSAFDVSINAAGGGQKGHADAAKLGISRALFVINIEWRPLLKAKGLLVRDSRSVERKKPGQKKARKRFQFVKR